MRTVRAADDEGVAAGFAVAANPAGENPHRRMEEQHRFHHALQQVHEVVPAADVGQLVEQDHFDFVGRPAGKRGGRQQDDRADDADEDGRGDAVADGDGDTPADAERLGELREERGDRAFS